MGVIADDNECLKYRHSSIFISYYENQIPKHMSELRRYISETAETSTDNEHNDQSEMDDNDN